MMQGLFELKRVAVGLRRVEVCTVPTESYYALAASTAQPAAVERLQVVKGRAASKAIALVAPGVQ